LKTLLKTFIILLICISPSYAKLDSLDKSIDDSRIQNNLTDSVVLCLYKETGLIVSVQVDTVLLYEIRNWQGKGYYPGTDSWVICELPDSTVLLGGLPGQTEFYTLPQTLENSNFSKNIYWTSLQVMAHPQFGYRSEIGEFILKGKQKAAISKTLANPQFGPGGAWQIYLPNYQSSLLKIQIHKLN
jgi:hypothetical protein